MFTANNVLLLVLILASGFWDLKERKIPNKVTFTGILIGILFNVFTGGFPGLLQSLIGLVAGLAIFFLPFAMGGMGAGDVKLMGAIGALMGWRFSLVTAMYSALVGGLMVLGYLLYKRKLRDTLKKMILSLIKLMFTFLNQLGYNETIEKMQQRYVKDGQTYKKIYIPYGVAIAGGAVLVLIASSQGFHIF
ncbi:MAG TPA: prepilin peptidase [Trichococcus sp.]|jgi:prepilin peptidase CpaA|nr:prepilin peptidase [Trichococcus sp.]